MIKVNVLRAMDVEVRCGRLGGQVMILASDWLIPILASDWLTPIVTSDWLQLLTTERRRRKETASVTKTGTLSSYDKRPAALVSQTTRVMPISANL